MVFVSTADGIASVLIGLLLGVTAFWLAVESKDLLLGESADPEIVAKVKEAAERHSGVLRAGEPLTMHLGPKNILPNLRLEIKPELSATETEAALRTVESRIRETVPEIRRILLDASRVPKEGRLP